jgi:hypothetical protein
LRSFSPFRGRGRGSASAVLTSHAIALPDAGEGARDLSKIALKEFASAALQSHKSETRISVIDMS